MWLLMGKNTALSLAIHDPSSHDDVSFYLAWENAESAGYACFKIDHDFCKIASLGLSGNLMTVKTCIQLVSNHLRPGVTPEWSRTC